MSLCQVRELAAALGIANANVSGTPRQEYPETLLNLVRHMLGHRALVHTNLLQLVRRISTIQMVEAVFEEFVRDPAKKAVCFAVDDKCGHAHTAVQHSFPIMKYEDRLIIHELAAIYQLSSTSQDKEPIRNVVVTRLPGARPVLPTPLLSELYTAPAASFAGAEWTTVRLVPYKAPIDDDI